MYTIKSYKTDICGVSVMANIKEVNDCHSSLELFQERRRAAMEQHRRDFQEQRRRDMNEIDEIDGQSHHKCS